MSGTLAAGIQSSIGNVTAGSLFALAQSTAMGGGVATIFPVIGAAVTGILAIGGTAVYKFFTSTATGTRVAAASLATGRAVARKLTKAGVAAYGSFKSAVTRATKVAAVFLAASGVTTGIVAMSSAIAYELLNFPRVGKRLPSSWIKLLKYVYFHCIVGWYFEL